MDEYKELIGIFRMTAEHGDVCYQCNHCIEAADAIEKLLEKLDALISEIKGDCMFCAYKWDSCVGCEDGSEWEWRGVTPENTKI